MGGFDKMEMGKGREAIKAYMDTLVPLVERGGYIPFCDHRCPYHYRGVSKEMIVVLGQMRQAAFAPAQQSFLWM